MLAGIGTFVNEAIRVDFGDSIQSLILLRTPMYENVLEESERGVTVSLGTMTFFRKSTSIETQPPSN